MYLFSYLSQKRQMNFQRLFFFNISEFFICIFLEVQNIGVQNISLLCQPLQYLSRTITIEFSRNAHSWQR